MEHDLAFTVFGYVSLRIAVIASVAAALYYVSRQQTSASRAPVVARLTSLVRPPRFGR